MTDLGISSFGGSVNIGEVGPRGEGGIDFGGGRKIYLDAISGLLDGDIPQFFNVKASPFGAKGNGAADDTAAIQAAIDTAEQHVLTSYATGGVVYLPPGVYVTSAPLTIKADNVVLFGGGKGYPTGASVGSTTSPVYGGTVIRPKSTFAGSWIIAVGQPGIPNRALGGVGLWDFSMDGSLLSGVTGGILFQCQRSQMRDIIIARTTGKGYYVEAPTHVTAFPFGAYDNIIRDVIVTQSATNPTNQGYGAHFSPGATDNMIFGQVVRGQAAGFPGIYNEGSGNQFHGGLVELCNDYAAYCAQSRNTKFIGMRFLDSAGGIFFTNGSAAEGGDFAVVGCTFRSVSRLGDNLADAIVVSPAYPMRGGVISGNDFSSVGRNDPGYRMRYGINIANANAIGVQVGPMSEGFATPSVGCFGTAPVLDAGAGTRRLDREPEERLRSRGQGFLGQSFDRAVVNTSSLMIGGTAYVAGLPLQEGDVVTNVHVEVGTVGTAVTLFKVSVLSPDGQTEYGRSADQSALFATGGVKTLPLVASFVAPSSGVYRVVIVATATTTLPGLWRGSSLSSATKIGGNAQPYGTAGAGLADLPAAPIAEGVANNPIAFWVGAS